MEYSYTMYNDCIQMVQSDLAFYHVVLTLFLNTLQYYIIIYTCSYMHLHVSLSTH